MGKHQHKNKQNALIQFSNINRKIHNLSMLKMNKVILFCLLTSLKLNAASKSHKQNYFTACLLLTILYKIVLNRLMYIFFTEKTEKLYLQ